MRNDQRNLSLLRSSPVIHPLTLEKIETRCFSLFRGMHWPECVHRYCTQALKMAYLVSDIH